MPQDRMLLLRTAERIRAHLQHVRDRTREVVLPEIEWDGCRSLIRQIGRAHARGWTTAAAILNDRLEQGILRCSRRLQELNHEFALSKGRPSVATVRDIFGDLVSLSDEFDRVSIDLSNQTLSVMTDTIELEDVNLGPFEIRLHWSRIGDRPAYDVVALEPNPARESSDTTHPHVKGDRLCEGDGRSAIGQALSAGRLLDFFQIVSQILNTYNSGSAYVSLTQWDGSPCSDCGAVVCEDDEYTCNRCDETVCSECLVSCGRCESICCHSCSDPCEACQESICRRCQQPCGGCDRLLCTSCLSETSLCEECQEHKREEFIEDEEVTPIESPASAAPTAGVPAPAVPEASITV